MATVNHESFNLPTICASDILSLKNIMIFAIVFDKWSRLSVWGTEGMITIKVVVVEKCKFEVKWIFFYGELTSYTVTYFTQFVYMQYEKLPNLWNFSICRIFNHSLSLIGSSLPVNHLAAGTAQYIFFRSTSKTCNSWLNNLNNQFDNEIKSV